MKFLSTGFIILAMLSCKPTKIDPNQITGKYKHGYAYQLNDYGLAEYDSIFIDLKDDRTFKYDRYYFGLSVLDHEKTSYGTWQFKGNKIILNTNDKKLKLNIVAANSLPINQLPKLRFSYDFNYNTGLLNISGDRLNIELDKAINLFLCENPKNCADLNKNSNFKTKLLVKDSISGVVTYERLLNLNVFPFLKQGKEYYFEVKVNDNIIKKYTSPVYRKSIRSESFTVSNNQNIDEISMYLQKFDDDFFRNEKDLDFYPLRNVKIHINNNNELKFKSRKLFKADTLIRYHWESKDEYMESINGMEWQP